MAQLGSGRGQKVARWAELLAVRDTLTERLLVPASSGSNLFEPDHFTPRPMNLFRTPERLLPAAPEALFAAGSGARDALPSRVTAVAIGHEDGEHFLTLFLDREDGSDPGVVAAGARMLERRGIPVRVRGAVTFVAASRPVLGGEAIGIGQSGGASGTLGCRVRTREDPRFLGLTCNHVIADLNAGTPGGTEVWAPGSGHGGTGADRLGVLHDFAAIDFAAGAYNLIDAALARPDHANDLDPSIVGLGQPAGINAALAFGDRLRKHGAAGLYGEGKYRYGINAVVEYAGGTRRALFKDLVGIVGLTAGANFASQGDSGAVVLDDANAVVGMVISVANGIDLTLATPIGPVLDHFEVDIA